MRALGFRAEKTLVHFAVLDDSKPGTVTTDKLKLKGDRPTAPELGLLRNEVRNLIDTYKPDAVGLRLSDKPQSMRYIQSSFDRARVEGVVMEAAASKNVKVVAGASATIKSGMKTKRPLREYADVDEVKGIDLSDKKNESLRDAVYAALAAMGK